MSHSGQSSGSGGSAGSMEGVKESGPRCDGKGGERVSHPIPIAGGKMKKRGVECNCNKVGWFYLDFIFCGFIYGLWLFFLRFSEPFSSDKRSNIKFCSRSSATQTA